MKKYGKIFILCILFILLSASICLAVSFNKENTPLKGYEGVFIPINSYQMNNISFTGSAKRFIDEHTLNTLTIMDYLIGMSKQNNNGNANENDTNNNTNSNEDPKKYLDQRNIGIYFAILGIGMFCGSIFCFVYDKELPGALLIGGGALSMSLGIGIWASNHKKYNSAVSEINNSDYEPISVGTEIGIFASIVGVTAIVALVVTSVIVLQNWEMGDLSWSISF
jgi:hypothetical protein